MAFFPLLLQALCELMSGLFVGASRPFRPSRTVLLICTGTTGAVFAATKLFLPAAQMWRWSLGALQWPFRAAAALGMGSQSLPRPTAVAHTVDPSDLVALPALAVAVALSWRR